MCQILIVDSQTSIKQLGCANTYFKYCMTNKIQYEAVVIHEILQEMIRQKQICSRDVPNFLLGIASHFLFFLIKNIQKAHLDNIGIHNRRI